MCLVPVLDDVLLDRMSMCDEARHSVYKLEINRNASFECAI